MAKYDYLQKKAGRKKPAVYAEGLAYPALPWKQKGTRTSRIKKNNDSTCVYTYMHACEYVHIT